MFKKEIEKQIMKVQMTYHMEAKETRCNLELFPMDQVHWYLALNKKIYYCPAIISSYKQFV